VPWLTISDALAETEKLLGEDAQNQELLAEVKAWLQTIGSSTMQTLVSLTDTSSPAEWSMLRFSF
jgi:hypothetical protein